MAEVHEWRTATNTAQVDNWTIIADLSSAISTCGPGGVVGSLDLSGVDTTLLAAAIPRAEDVGVKTPEAASLLAAAKLLLRLRTALLQDHWSADSSAGDVPDTVEAVLVRGGESRAALRRTRGWRHPLTLFSP